MFGWLCQAVAPHASAIPPTVMSPTSKAFSPGGCRYRSQAAGAWCVHRRAPVVRWPCSMSGVPFSATHRDWVAELRAPVGRRSLGGWAPTERPSPFDCLLMQAKERHCGQSPDRRMLAPLSGRDCRRLAREYRLARSSVQSRPLALGKTLGRTHLPPPPSGAAVCVPAFFCPRQSLAMAAFARFPACRPLLPTSRISPVASPS